MKLPNGDRAIIDVAGKLLGYCLNHEHRLGRHKARVFSSALGITSDDPTGLVDALRAAAAGGDAQMRKTNDFGAEYEIQFSMDGPHGPCIVLSAWFIDKTTDVPRLTNCYVSLNRTRKLRS